MDRFRLEKRKTCSGGAETQTREEQLPSGRFKNSLTSFRLYRKNNQVSPKWTLPVFCLRNDHMIHSLSNANHKFCFYFHFLNLFKYHILWILTHCYIQYIQIHLLLPLLPYPSSLLLLPEFSPVTDMTHPLLSLEMHSPSCFWNDPCSIINHVATFFKASVAPIILG